MEGSFFENRNHCSFLSAFLLCVSSIKNAFLLRATPFPAPVFLSNHHPHLPSMKKGIERAARLAFVDDTMGVKTLSDFDDVVNLSINKGDKVVRVVASGIAHLDDIASTWAKTCGVYFQTTPEVYAIPGGAKIENNVIVSIMTDKEARLATHEWLLGGLAGDGCKHERNDAGH
jgi:hypothetical protein